MDKTERRRIAKQAKKLKLKTEKDKLKKERLEKKNAIVAKIRASRAQAREQYKLGMGKKAFDAKCWNCGSKEHTKGNCTEAVRGEADTICFGCRKRGHSIQQCPLSKTEKAIKCYNCGALDHAARVCKRKKYKDGFSFAECFLCKQVGHLANACSKSTLGIYPNGGECRVCSSIFHLARNCPKVAKKNKNVKTEVGMVLFDPMDSGDAITVEGGDNTALKVDESKPTQKTTKRVVVF